MNVPTIRARRISSTRIRVSFEIKVGTKDERERVHFDLSLERANELAWAIQHAMASKVGT